MKCVNSEYFILHLYKELRMIKNIDKINSVKRSKVEIIVNHIDKCNKEEIIIKKVIIFGSAITDVCTEESDIDMCIVPQVSTSDLRFIDVVAPIDTLCDDVCDIVAYSHIGGSLLREIDIHGICVYEIY